MDFKNTKTGDSGLSAFFGSLLPNFEKRRILEDMEAAYKDLVDLRDLYGSVPGLYDDVFASGYKGLMRELDKRVAVFNGDIVSTVLSISTARIAEKADMEKFIDDVYGQVVIKDSMDYRKLQMLRYVELMPFFITYARKLLIAATNDLISKDKARLRLKSIHSVVDKLDKEFLSDSRNIRAFAIMVNAMTHDIKSIRSRLDAMSKVRFSPDTHDTINSSQSNLSDPLRFGMVPILGSAVYSLGRAYNLYIAHRQELAQEELAKLRIKVLLLQRLRETTTDTVAIAKLDKQIKYHDSRVNKIESRLEDMEDI